MGVASHYLLHDEFVSPGTDELLKVYTLWYVHVTHDLTISAYDLIVVIVQLWTCLSGAQALRL